MKQKSDMRADEPEIKLEPDAWAFRTRGGDVVANARRSTGKPQGKPPKTREVIRRFTLPARGSGSNTLGLRGRQVKRPVAFPPAPRPSARRRDVAMNLTGGSERGSKYAACDGKVGEKI
jgi:hypothetical protein